MSEPVDPMVPSDALDPSVVERFDLASYLLGRGADPAAVRTAQAEGPEALRRLGYGTFLLGGPPSLTAPEVWERVGADEDLARSLWRAMGFANLPDDAQALTEADVAALSAINEFLSSVDSSPEIAIRFTRLMGQTMGRVADALVSIVDEGIDGLGLVPGDPDDLAVMAADVVNPLIERELIYLLRRHLYAVATRRLAGPDEERDAAVVGFADVVQFTRLSGQLPEGDLAELLEVFEAETSDAITDHGGRVVKLIGDAVMFEVDDDHRAACLALDLVESFGGDRPDLRVGMAHGPTMSRQGDLFGPVVNLASRLVGFARPGTVVIDEPLAEHLRGRDEFDLRQVRTRDLKGLGTTTVYVLRRADEG